MYKIIILQGRQRGKGEKGHLLTNFVFHTRCYCPSFARDGDEQMLCATHFPVQSRGSEQKAVLGIVFFDPAVTSILCQQVKWACEALCSSVKEKQEESPRSLNPVPTLIWWPRRFGLTLLQGTQVSPCKAGVLCCKSTFKACRIFRPRLHEAFLQ